MELSFNVTFEYGYVLLIVCSSWFLTNWLEARTLQARRRYEVPFPKMTIEPYTHEFNCIMRAYQNTLESYPHFLVFTLLGGLSYPKVSSVCGLLWIISRVVYTRGYYTGDPEQKKYGAFGQFAMFVLFLLNIAQALQVLGVI